MMMILQEFSDALEFALTRALQGIREPALAGFWCDGIILDDHSIEMPDVSETLTGIAFLGNTGQDRYELKLTLGSHSRSGLLPLDQVIPDAAAEAWFEIDTVRKKIAVRLL